MMEKSITECKWVRGRVLGEGSFGCVYLGTDTSSGLTFAVKSTSTQINCLKHEYTVLSSLDSPHVIKCLGQCYQLENGVGMHNLFMEHAPGGSLADHRNMKEECVRKCALGILLGLEYIHGQGLVHCDVKARNMLLDSQGNVKIGDFGSSRRVGVEGPCGLRGTPLWMAPEVIREEEQGPESDIWSLGCTILEMLTGRPPWNNEDSLHGPLHRIGFSEDLPMVPLSVSMLAHDFLSKCLVRDPRKRWSCKQLLNHPFVSSGEGMECCDRLPQSPTTPFDFGRMEERENWDSSMSMACSSSNTFSRNQQSGQDRKLSAQRRICQLASQGDGKCWFDQFIQPDSHWIVVKCSEAVSSDVEIPAAQSNQDKFYSGFASPSSSCSHFSFGGNSFASSIEKIPSPSDQLLSSYCLSSFSNHAFFPISKKFFCTKDDNKSILTLA